MQVRSAREARGWSQEHLAAASGVSLRTVQRAEAGARISAENTLALCATLELDTSGMTSVPSTGPETLPHLASLRSALDGALAGSGERAVWRKADASPLLRDALRRMGLPADACGFEEASRRVERRKGVLDMVEVALTPFVALWGIGFVLLPMALFCLPTELSANRYGLGLALALWLCASAALLLAGRRLMDACGRIQPCRMPEIVEAGIVVSDLRPVEAALTPGFLWIARPGFGQARVIRISLDAIREVVVSRAEDGFHSARFRVDGLPVAHDDDMPTFDLTRLGDEEARWLDRRFAGIRKAIVWTPETA